MQTATALNRIFLAAKQSLFVLFVFAGLMTITAATNAEQGMRSAQIAQSFSPTNSVEKAVLAVVTDKIVAAYKNSDGALMETALSASFKRRLINSTKTMLQETRADFLKDFETLFSGQTVEYAIQSMKTASDGGSAAVIAMATYRSKSFNPRYLETLIFRKEGGAWKLSSQTLLPLHPISHKSHKVEIFLTQPFWPTDKYKNFGDYFVKSAAVKGPEAVIAELRQKTKRPDSNESHAIAVFREPPRPNSKIEFLVTFHTTTDDYEFETEYPVKYLNSYFIAESIAEGEYNADQISIGVGIDGKSLGSKKFDN
jgi:hypothetical protein